MFSIEDFNIIKKFLDNYDINYEEGTYTNDFGQIIGHWMKIDCDVETWEVSEEEDKN